MILCTNLSLVCLGVLITYGMRTTGSTSNALMIIHKQHFAKPGKSPENRLGQPPKISKWASHSLIPLCTRVMTISKILNLHLTKDAPTYMECIFEEKLKIIQEMVDREAG